MLILAMSLSGSAVFVVILLSAILGKRALSSGWLYNMLRIDLAFFCLPLPVYNSEYKHIVSDILGRSRQWNGIDFATKNIIGIEESGRFYLNFQAYIIAIWAVWTCGMLFILVKDICSYNKVKVQKAGPQIDKLNYLAIFDKVKKELGIKKGVALLCANDAKTVCTIGMLRKYVIVPENGMTNEELYYSFKHELIHAKRSDVVWRYIGLFAVLMHWFNPLVYLYLYVLSIYCEQSCDAILVQNLDKPERKKYGELIIKMSMEEESGGWKYQAYLSRSKKMIKWRLTNMLKVEKKKRIEKMFSLLLGVMILFGGSLTVCAYENPQVIRDIDKPVIDVSKDTQIMVDFVDTEEIRFTAEHILTKAEFVGDDGVCYDLSEMQNSAGARAGCIHSYESGYCKVHYKYSDGTCKTDYYTADKCKKCNEIVMKDYSHTETSTKCTHY